MDSVSCIEKDQFCIDNFHLFVSDLTKYSIKKEDIQFTDLTFIDDHNFKVHKSGIGLMHIAALWNCLDEFIYLHKVCNLDINVKDSSGHLPLHYACSQGSTEIVAYILSQLSAEEFNKPEMKHSLCLSLAARTKSWRIIDILCKKGIDVKNHGENAIKIAALLSDIDILRTLLSYCGENSEITSPVISAIAFGNIDVLQTLFANGCEADRIYNGMLPLHKALESYTVNHKLVEVILRYSSKYDIDVQYKLATVHYICKCSDPQIAAVILAHDIQVNKLDYLGRPGPYYFQSKPQGDPVAILDMLYNHGYNVNIKFGNPSISMLQHFLHLFGKWEKVIKWYVEHGADLDEPYDTKNNITVRDVIKKKFPNIDIP